MTDHSVSCPQTIRTANRRVSKSRTYGTKQWKEDVSAFVRGKSCEWCSSKEKLLAHHPYMDTPDGVYSDLYLSGCIVLCSTCHFMFHRRHKKRCPICKVGWMPLDTDMCYPCNLKANPGKAEAIAAEKEARLENRRQYNAQQAAKRKKTARKHRCRFHRVRGVCGKSAIGSQCPYSIRKAEGQCMDFEAKKQEAVHG
jgi:hypothetical protein